MKYSVNIGDRFGRLVVVALSRTKGTLGNQYFECICDCGTLKTIRGHSLASGVTKSCKCLQRDFVTTLMSTHGKSGTPEYGAWTAILQRCRNEKHKHYAYYGGRGIECRFESFEAFFADIGPRPSLKHTVDRKNTNGHYEAGNVQWATRKEQSRNIRSNRFITYKGESLLEDEWRIRYGLGRGVISARINRLGWSVEKALNTPSKRRRPSPYGRLDT